MKEEAEAQASAPSASEEALSKAIDAAIFVPYSAGRHLELYSRDQTGFMSGGPIASGDAPASRSPKTSFASSMSGQWRSNLLTRMP
jgi:hypothetical protein